MSYIEKFINNEEQSKGTVTLPLHEYLYLLHSIDALNESNREKQNNLSNAYVEIGKANEFVCEFKQKVINLLAENDYAFKRVNLKDSEGNYFHSLETLLDFDSYYNNLNIFVKQCRNLGYSDSDIKEFISNARANDKLGGTDNEE